MATDNSDYRAPQTAFNPQTQPAQPPSNPLFNALRNPTPAANLGGEPAAQGPYQSQAAYTSPTSLYNATSGLQQQQQQQGQQTPPPAPKQAEGYESQVDNNNAFKYGPGSLYRAMQTLQAQQKPQPTQVADATIPIDQKKMQDLMKGFRGVK